MEALRANPVEKENKKSSNEDGVGNETPLSPGTYVSFPSWQTAYGILKEMFKRGNSKEVMEELGSALTSYCCNCTLRGRTIKYSATVYTATSLPVGYDGLEVINSLAIGEDEYGGAFLLPLIKKLSDSVMLLWRYILFQKRILILGKNPGTVGDVVLAAASLVKPLRGIRYHIIPNLCLTDSLPHVGLDGSSLLIAGSTNEMQEKIMKFDLVIKLVEDNSGNVTVDKSKELHSQLDEGEIEFMKFLKSELQNYWSDTSVREQLLLFTYYALLYINLRLSKHTHNKTHSRNNSKGHGSAQEGIGKHGNAYMDNETDLKLQEKGNIHKSKIMISEENSPSNNNSSLFSTPTGYKSASNSIVDSTSGYDFIGNYTSPANISQEMTKSELKILKSQFLALFGREKGKFFPRTKFRLSSKFSSFLKHTDLPYTPIYNIFLELNKKLMSGASFVPKEGEKTIRGVVRPSDMIDSMMYFDGCSLNNSTSMVLELINHNKILTSFVNIASEKFQKMQKLILGGDEFINSIIEKWKEKNHSSTSNNTSGKSPTYNSFGPLKDSNGNVFELFINSSPFKSFIHKKRSQDIESISLAKSYIEEYDPFASSKSIPIDMLNVMDKEILAFDFPEAFSVSTQNTSSQDGIDKNDNNQKSFPRTDSQITPSTSGKIDHSSKANTEKNFSPTSCDFKNDFDTATELRPLQSLLKQKGQNLKEKPFPLTLKLDLPVGVSEPRSSCRESSASRARRNIMTPTSSPWRGNEVEKKMFLTMKIDFEAFLMSYIEMRMIGILCLTYVRTSRPKYGDVFSPSVLSPVSDVGDSGPSSLEELKHSIKKLRRRLEKMVGKWYRGYNPKSPVVPLLSPGDSKMIKAGESHSGLSSNKMKGLRIKIGIKEDKQKSGKGSKKDKVKTPSGTSHVTSFNTNVADNNNSGSSKNKNQEACSGKNELNIKNSENNTASYQLKGSDNKVITENETWTNAVAQHGNKHDSVNIYQGIQQLPPTVTAHSSLLSLFNILFIFVSHYSDRVRSLALQCIELLTRSDEDQNRYCGQSNIHNIMKYNANNLRGSYMNIINSKDKNRAFRKEVSKLARSSALQNQRSNEIELIKDVERFADGDEEKNQSTQFQTPANNNSLMSISPEQKTNGKSDVIREVNIIDDEDAVLKGLPTNPLIDPIVKTEPRGKDVNASGKKAPSINIDRRNLTEQKSYDICPPSPSVLKPRNEPGKNNQPKSLLMSLILKEIVLRNYDDLLILLLQSSDLSTRNIVLQILINICEQQEITDDIISKEAFWNSIIGFLYFRELESSVPLVLLLLKTIFTFRRPCIKISPHVQKVLIRHLFQMQPDDVDTVPSILTYFGIDVVALLTLIKDEESDINSFYPDFLTPKQESNPNPNNNNNNNNSATNDNSWENIVGCSIYSPDLTGKKEINFGEQTSLNNIPMLPIDKYRTFDLDLGDKELNSHLNFEITPESLYNQAFGLFVSGKSIIPYLPKYEGSPLSLLRASCTGPISTLRQRVKDGRKYAKRMYNYITSLETFTLFLPQQSILPLSLNLKPFKATALIMHLMRNNTRSFTLPFLLVDKSYEPFWNHIGKYGFRVFEGLIRWVIESKWNPNFLEELFLKLLKLYIDDRGKESSNNQPFSRSSVTPSTDSGSNLKKSKIDNDDSSHDSTEMADQVETNERLDSDAIRVFKRTLKLIAVCGLYEKILSHPLIIKFRVVDFEESLLPSGTITVENKDRKIKNKYEIVLTQRNKYLHKFLESINSKLT